MPTVERSIRDHWLETAPIMGRRTILGQLSKAMCITALFSVVWGSGDAWAGRCEGESSMGVLSEAAAANRRLGSNAEPCDDTLRMHWASFKSIPTIARVMDVKTGWVRSRAMSIGLTVRPRSTIIGGT